MFLSTACFWYSLQWRPIIASLYRVISSGQQKKSGGQQGVLCGACCDHDYYYCCCWSLIIDWLFLFAILPRTRRAYRADCWKSGDGRSEPTARQKTIGDRWSVGGEARWRGGMKKGTVTRITVIMYLDNWFLDQVLGTYLYDKIRLDGGARIALDIIFALCFMLYDRYHMIFCYVQL